MDRQTFDLNASACGLFDSMIYVCAKASLLNVQKTNRKTTPIDETRFACHHKRRKRTIFQRVKTLLLRASTEHYVFVALGSCACLPTSLVVANCCWWWWCASREGRTHMVETLRLRHGTCPLAHPCKTHANMQQLSNSRRFSLTESGEVRLRNVHAW